MSGKHGRPRPPRRAPEPVGVGAVAAQVAGVGAVAAQVAGVGAAAAPMAAVAAPIFAPPAPTPLPPVIHNRPLPDFDRDNPLGLADPLPEPVLEPAHVPAPEPELAAAPAPATLPLGHEILPSGPARNSGSLARLLADRRRLLLAVLALVVVVGLVAWLLLGGSGTSTKKAPVAAPVVGRTQSTLLIELKGSLGVAVDTALVANDPATHNGAIVLVPSNVQTQVPGFGSMPFGQALSVGDPSAPTGALSDLMGVTIDGSWTLTSAGLAALVDKLGGVTVAVDKDVTTTANGTTSIIVRAGTQKLSGASAVAFATFLESGAPEQARLTRFDAVLDQVIAGLPKTEAGLTPVLASLGAGSTSTFAPARLATFLVGLATDNTSGTVTDQQLPVTPLEDGTGQPAYTLDVANTTKLVDAQLAASVPASRKVTGNRVYVQNQVGTPGLGATARARLVAAGFVYEQGQNTADMPNPTAPSVVVILGPTSAQIDQGDAVARALGLPISDVRVANDGFSVADVLVKLGADYKQ